MKYFLFILFVSSNAWSLDFGGSVGMGLQYGGFTGGNLNLGTEDFRSRAAIGIWGYSAGFDKKISEKVSLGLTFGDVYSIDQYRVLNVNYHFKTMKEGLRLSLDLGFGEEPDSCGKCGFEKQERQRAIAGDTITIALVSIGVYF